MTDPKPIPAMELFMRHQAEINRVASLRAQCVKRYERLKASGMDKSTKSLNELLVSARQDLRDKHAAFKDSRKKLDELEEINKLHNEYLELIKSTEEAEKGLEASLHGFSFVQTGTSPAPLPLPEPQTGQKRPAAEPEVSLPKKPRVRVVGPSRPQNLSRAELRKKAAEEDAEHTEHTGERDSPLAHASKTALATNGANSDSDDADMIPVASSSSSSSSSSTSVVGVVPPPASSSSAAMKPRTEQSAVAALAHLASKK